MSPSSFTKDCHDLGIVIHGTFILGLPGETLDTIEETIEYAKEINPHTIQVSLAAPYPGTFLYKQATENGWFDNSNDLLTEGGTQIAQLSYPHLPASVIFDKVEEFYKRFYFRPRKIGSIVGEMVRDFDMMKRRLREGVEFFSFLHKPEEGGVAIRRLIVTADDFGASVAVNEAVEQAHREGILTAASLMVAGDAAADAVARARTMPSLGVGLHLVLVEGRPVLPPAQIPALVDATGRFRRDMARYALRMFADPAARRQLAAEVDAQFAAFAATGLPLDHVNAHKHFHLHPTIASTVLAVGQAVRHDRDPRAAGTR